MTITMITARINELRTELGMNTIKAWKASVAAGLDAIAKLEASLPVADVAADTSTDDTPALPGDATPKQVKSVTVAEPDEPTTVTLANIAKSMSLDAKVARSKARRHADAFKAFEVSRHEYPVADRDAIVALLRGDARRKVAADA